MYLATPDVMKRPTKLPLRGSQSNLRRWISIPSLLVVAAVLLTRRECSELVPRVRVRNLDLFAIGKHTPHSVARINEADEGIGKEVLWL